MTLPNLIPFGTSTEGARRLIAERVGSTCELSLPYEEARSAFLAFGGEITTGGAFVVPEYVGPASYGSLAEALAVLVAAHGIDHQQRCRYEERDRVLTELARDAQDEGGYDLPSDRERSS